MSIEELYSEYWTGGDCAQARQAFIAGVNGVVEVLSRIYADMPATYEEAMSPDQHQEKIRRLLENEKPC